MSDNSEVLCENCSSNLTNKLISKSSFTLKGNGWYKDGYSEKSKEVKKESNG